MTEDQLIDAILQGKKEAEACKEDGPEWKLIRDTVIAIGEELERRKVK